jgi:hypothetical protein
MKVAKTVLAHARVFALAFCTAAAPVAAQSRFLEVPPPEEEEITYTDPLEVCILHALEQNLHMGDPVLIHPVHDDTASKKVMQMRYLAMHQRRDFHVGGMIVIDYTKAGIGSLGVYFSRVERGDENLELDANPNGFGTYTRVLLDKDDVLKQGRFDSFSGPKALVGDIDIIKVKAFGLVDGIRNCWRTQNPGLTPGPRIN